MSIRTKTAAPTHGRVIPDAPPANILIPPQQTFEIADHEHIRTRAYQLWEAAGRPEGDGAEFWHRAERELHAG
ncbi:MAG TPA: DUF2934 domain-containing protein [Urbifossiella sp.]|nr:DUF2934 domain-containing protein [Urbifossiella sp.]